MLGIILTLHRCKNKLASSIFGKDHYIKFCITTFSWQKMLNQQDNTELGLYVVCCVLCLRLNFTFLVNNQFFMTIVIGFFIRIENT